MIAIANLIAVMGESGSGKTTSLRNLDPKTTYIIDCDKKGLSWRGWREQYNAANNNYAVMDDQSKVLTYLASINVNAPHIRTVVVDTLNGIMVADEGRRRKEKGYDKWSDLAWSVYDIVDYALTMRDDLTVIFTAHSQTEADDSGNRFTRIKTSGKKLDKIMLESKFPTVFLAKCVDGEYKFETRANSSTAKSPMGCFTELLIDNDMASIDAVLRDYMGMKPLTDSAGGGEANA